MVYLSMLLKAIGDRSKRIEHQNDLFYEYMMPSTNKPLPMAAKERSEASKKQNP